MIINNWNCRFLDLVIEKGIQEYLIVVLIFSYYNKLYEHIFVYLLAIYIFSLVRYLLDLLPIFKLSCLLFIVEFDSLLYNLCI